MGKNLPAMQETQEVQVWSWVGKIPWRRKRQPPPALSPGESHGQRSLAATARGAAESRTQLSDQEGQQEGWV